MVEEVDDERAVRPPAGLPLFLVALELWKVGAHILFYKGTINAPKAREMPQEVLEMAKKEENRTDK